MVAVLRKGLLEMLELDPADRRSNYLKQRLEMFLVGDSGENDPTIYAAVARAHPRNVLKIFIHLVLADFGHRKRVADGFEDLPRHCWGLYLSGSQLSEMARLPALKSSSLRQPADTSLLPAEGWKR